jgi:hypothetical protein
MIQTTFFRLLKTPIDDKGDAPAAQGPGELDETMVKTAANGLESRPFVRPHKYEIDGTTDQRRKPS